jgi:hypothetical protein
VGFFVLYRSHQLQIQVVIAVLSIPAVTSLVVGILGTFFEGLRPQAKKPFPNNITLPLIHCSLILLLGRLLTTAPSALEKLPAQVAPIAIWQHWQVLAMCAVFEAGVISLYSLSGWPI